MAYPRLLKSFPGGNDLRASMQGFDFHRGRIEDVWDGCPYCVMGKMLVINDMARHVRTGGRIYLIYKLFFVNLHNFP